MAISLKHTFQSAKADGADSSLVQPSNWNAEHTMTAAAGTVIGRDTSGNGAVQELPLAVTTTGDLGVGTASPGARLDVVANGSTYARVYDTSGSGGAYLQLKYGASDVSEVQGYAATMGFYNNDSTNGKFVWSATSEKMRLTAAGNLGLGRSSPAAKLDINGSVATFDGGYFYTPYNGATNTATVRAGIQLDGANQTLNFYTSNTYRGGMNASGNVGIGTASPNGPLQVKTSGGQWRIEANSTGTKMVGVNAADNAEDIITMQGSPITFFSNGSERMRVTSSGNVGIGTSSPSYKLDVTGQVRLSNGVAQASPSTTDIGSTSQTIIGGQGGNALYFGQYGGTQSYAQWVQASFQNPSTATYNLILQPIGGAVGVGTTTNTVNPNGIWLDPNGSVAVGNNAQASGWGFAYFARSGTTIGSITQNGTTAVLYNTTSDQRLKENIADADDAAVLIDAIKVRKFDWKADGTHQRYGFVAQELVDVAPEAVHQPQDENEMMAVDYSKLVPMMLKEIQSLRARVAELEGK